MADQTAKVAVIGVIGTVIVAIIGATQEPWWWCRMVGCAVKAEAPLTAASPGLVASQPEPGKPAQPAEPEYEIIPAQPEHMGELLMATNLDRSDINNGERVQNVQACVQLCAESAVCKAMTYVYANVDDTQNGICWLKGTVPPALPNPNMISAKKIPATPERKVLKPS